jgi:hypothetical protein
MREKFSRAHRDIKRRRFLRLIIFLLLLGTRNISSLSFLIIQVITD